MMNAQEFQAALAAVNMPQRSDPVLQELWDIKAKINQNADYDVRRIVENATRNTAHLVGANGRVRDLGN